MWALDRLSAHPTPSGSPYQRAPSPSPRRPGLGALPQRPPYGPRSSSLSLASTPSTTSLSGSARYNGSALKNELYSAPPEDLDDPLTVLRSILGDVPQQFKNAESNLTTLTRPDSLVKDIEFGGLSLEAFAEQDEETEAVASREVKSAQECM